MKKGFITGIVPAALIVLITFMLTACLNVVSPPEPESEEHEGKGQVWIVIDTENTNTASQNRSAVPNDPGFSYTLIFTMGTKTETVDITSSDWDVWLDDGVWNLKVYGTKDGHRIAESEDIQVPIAAGGDAAVVRVSLHPVNDGTPGTFHYKISFEEDGVTSSTLTLTALNSIQIIPAVSLSGSGGEGNIELDPGFYRLQVTAEKQGGVFVSPRVTVLIYSRTVTEGEYTFTAEDFTATKHTTISLDLSGIPGIKAVAAYACNADNPEEFVQGEKENNSWGIYIPVTYENVYFKIVMEKDDGSQFDYVTGAGPLADIPPGGKSFIVISRVVDALDLSAPAAAPVTGGVPQTAIDADQYTGTIAWKTGADVDFTGLTFAASTVYKAALTLTPKNVYTFTGVAADSFTHSGASGITNAADSNEITSTFHPAASTPAPDTTVNQ